MLPRALLAIAGCLGAIALSAAAPTEERDFQSLAGTTIRAVASAISGGKVALNTPDGRLITVPLAQFAEADRSFLAEHFNIDPILAATTTSGAAPATSLPHPLGEVIGPITASGGAHFKGISQISELGHTTPEIEQAATNLADQFANIPHIEETARALSQPTVGN